MNQLRKSPMVLLRVILQCPFHPVNHIHKYFPKVLCFQCHQISCQLTKYPQAVDFMVQHHFTLLFTGQSLNTLDFSKKKGKSPFIHTFAIPIQSLRVSLGPTTSMKASMILPALLVFSLSNSNKTLELATLFSI